MNFSLMEIQFLKAVFQMLNCPYKWGEIFDFTVSAINWESMVNEGPIYKVFRRHAQNTICPDEIVGALMILNQICQGLDPAHLHLSMIYFSTEQEAPNPSISWPTAVQPSVSVKSNGFWVYMKWILV